MTPREFLLQFPRSGDFSRKSKVLLFAYYLRHHKALTEFHAAELKACFRESLVRVPTDLGALLAALSRGRGSPLLHGSRKKSFVLSIDGLREVEAVLPAAATNPQILVSFLDAAVPHLRRAIAKVKDPARKDYLAEAISCLAVGAKRATIVLAWLATMDHMYEVVLKRELDAFQSALSKRSDRFGKMTVRGHEDLLEINDVVFIEVCRSAGVIGNDVRKILDQKLGTRNSCAHPAHIAISDAGVVSFVEDLVENVISKYET